MRTLLAASPPKSLRGRSLVALSGAVWLTFGVIQCVQLYVLAHAVNRPWTLSTALITGMPWWISWFALTPLIALLASRYTFTEGRVWRPLFAHVLASVVISCLHLLATATTYWFSTGRTAGVVTSLGNQIQR